MIVEKLRQFIKEAGLDYLIVNTTDEFLVEYNELKNTARYFVTGFSGSTGDVLISESDVWQFVDGRYHQQADDEVDEKITSVVKLRLGESFTDALSERVKENSKVGIVSKKVSLTFYKIIKKKFAEKNIKIVDLDYEPVERFVKFETSGHKCRALLIPDEISGCSADEKIKKIFSKLRKNQIYLETNLENIAYLTNLRQFKTPFSSVFKAKLVIHKDRATIYTDEEIEIPGKYFELKPLSEFRNFLVPKCHILYNPGTINYADYKLIKRNAVELRKNLVSEMKSVKNDAEIRHFKENFRRTDNVVKEIEDFIDKHDNLNEYKISEEVEKLYIEQGAKQLSFKTILASGSNSSVIHYSHPSKDVSVKDGDFVLLDCGAHFEGGYSTDITRTFVKGAPSKQQKRVYTTVLKMFLNAYHHKVTSRTTGATLDRIARKIAKKSGLIDEGFNFNHGLGHGVGINVHECPPSISSSKQGRKFLKENMVFTIEPGLYKKDFGGVRLENTVFLTKKDGEFRIESFSKMPFQEKCVEYELLNEQEKKWFYEWQNSHV